MPVRPRIASANARGHLAAFPVSVPPRRGKLPGVDPENSENSETFSPVEVRCYFVRGRNALLVRGQFEPLFVDYYLHLAQHQLQMNPFQDATFKEALAALTLHLASKPWNEHHAWTVHFQRPLMNLFVCGDNTTARIAGRVFDQMVKDTERNLFFSRMQKTGMPEPRSSTIDFEDPNIFRAVERFYHQSEQRPARFFEHSPEDYVFISAQPQCDVPWLESLSADAVRTLDQTEELSLLETRHYHFECGCDVTRIWEVLLPHCTDGVDGLFEGEPLLRVGCPRCGAVYRINREQFEAFVETRARK
ncbi:MAG: Hsp33 family molecular chaperone HslO [Verrucomicrobiales bacterium]|nr:Hsp33 family molecular chaperone HslO [Verrucomicrobiales bacterium]